jgi:hypothetical protein
LPTGDPAILGTVLTATFAANSKAARASAANNPQPRHRNLRHATPYDGTILHKNRQSSEAFITSTQTLRDAANKIFYFSLVATAFVFISMLLATSPHP